MFRFIQLKNVCSSTAKAHPHLLNGLSECIPSTDIPYVSAIKGGARKWIHCAQSAFARKVFVLYSKHTTQDGIQSSLSAPGLQSLDSAQMSNWDYLSCGMRMVFSNEGWECTIITPFTIWTWVNKVMLTWYVKNSASSNNGATMYLLLLNYLFLFLAKQQLIVFFAAGTVHSSGINFHWCIAWGCSTFPAQYIASDNNANPYRLQNNTFCQIFLGNSSSKSQ